MIRRSAIAVAIVALAAAAIHRLVILPHGCNVVEETVRQSTRRIAGERDQLRVRPFAESNLAQLERCLDICRTDVRLPFLAGVNLMILGRPDAAAAMYRRALEYDQRPEIYAALAKAQVAMGDHDGAVRNLVVAGAFAGKNYLLDFDDPVAGKEAFSIVAEHEARAAAARGDVEKTLLFNGNFTAAGPRGASTEDSGQAAQWPSAADAWMARVNVPATVTTQLVPSTRRPGGTMLRVNVGSADSGVFQLWGPRRGRAPERVVTTAWVFVRSGRVYIGSGNGAATNTDVNSMLTGRWEQLEASNRSCPANQTVVYAASEGADFDVDEVTVVEWAGPPCEPR